MNEEELLDEALRLIVAAETAPWVLEGRKSPAVIAIERFEAERGQLRSQFDPVRDGHAVINRCPEASRVALTELFGSMGSDLYAMALGGGDIDDWAPRDLYATRLSGDEVATWRFTEPGVSEGTQLRLYDVSEGPGLVEDGIVTYDPDSGSVAIDGRRLPNDGKWRLLWLTSASSPRSATFSEGSVFCVQREPLSDAARYDPAAAILSGHFWHAWNLATQQEGWNDNSLLFLLGVLFTRMQRIIRDEVLDTANERASLGSTTARMRNSELDVLIGHLERSLSQRINPIKQGFWDKFSVE